MRKKKPVSSEELQIIEAIRNGRIKRGLSCRRLGEMVGLSGASVTNIELGRVRLTVANLIAFHWVLNLPLGKILNVKKFL